MRTPPAIVGREDELAAARQFVIDTASGPAALVLEGVAGIGKTAIWAEAVRDARARGVALRICRCSESDTAWAFAGLGDLFEGLDPVVLSALPAVQQQALSAALLLDDGGRSPGHHVVGVAILGVLRLLSRTAPLVLAVDDVQWMDTSSRNVLTFVLRRLVDEPVRLLVSHRTGVLADAAGDPGLGLSGHRMVVGPVTIGVLQRIVTTHISQGFSRPTLIRLHQATGGNPMVSLEMARALQRRGREPAVDEPLPVPADLRVLVTERLRLLSESGRQVLLVAAALARPTAAAIAAAMDEPEPATRALP
ncbi:MAG TPA: AAA family ATPase, partial [Micromonosporaceae bacterium]